MSAFDEFVIVESDDDDAGVSGGLVDGLLVEKPETIELRKRLTALVRERALTAFALLTGARTELDSIKSIVFGEHEELPRELVVFTQHAQFLVDEWCNEFRSFFFDDEDLELLGGAINALSTMATVLREFGQIEVSYAINKDMKDAQGTLDWCASADAAAIFGSARLVQ